MHGGHESRRGSREGDDHLGPETIVPNRPRLRWKQTTVLTNTWPLRRTGGLDVGGGLGDGFKKRQVSHMGENEEERHVSFLLPFLEQRRESSVGYFCTR